MSIISQQVFASPGQVFSSISGGGGGGGSGNPNPIVSTLTFDGNAPNKADIIFPAAYNAASRQDAWLYKVARGGGAASYIELDISGQDTQTGFPGIAINSGAGSTTEITNEFGSTTIYCGGQINLSTPQLTLNGGPIGSGGNVFPQIQVSSSAGNPASLYIAGNDADLYSFYVSSANGITSMNLGIQSGGRKELYSDTMEAPDFYTSTIKGATGQISLNPSGTEQIRIGGTGAPGDITIASSGGGNINLTGPTNVSQGLFNVGGTASISSLTASSINGVAYPPPAPAPTAPGYYTWIPEQQTIYSGTLPNILNYSTITPSPVFSTTTGFTLSGSLTCSVTFQGAGNTNPVTNVAQTSNASFGLYMIMDGQQIPLTSLSFTTTGNSSPGGQYNSVAPSFNSNNNLGAFIVQPNYNFNSPSASPGVEFTYSALGAHTFQLFAWTDLFMASGDPTANYNTILRFPRSADFSATGILVQYH